MSSKLLPGLTGRLPPDDLERRLLSLPTREGGMGVRLIEVGVNRELDASVSVSQPVVSLMLRQECSASEMVKALHASRLQAIAISKERKTTIKAECEALDVTLPIRDRVLRHQNSQRGCSTWLAVQPCEAQGLVFNKSDFRDALALRYGWTVPDIPSVCV